jgi:hypothetical protein
MSNHPGPYTSSPPLRQVDPLDVQERIALTQRPAGRPAGYQSWRHLSFLHWRLPAEELRPLIPRPLEIDTFDGDAWIGIVLFHMSNVQPWRQIPPLPGCSRFPETNVRTYVHLAGRRPGVWFFSLDAANPPAVLAARAFWKLPYYRSRMSVERVDPYLRYTSRRLWPKPAGAHTNIEVEIGEVLGRDEPRRARPAGQAIPGTLEFFLAERYLLYTGDGHQRLWSCQVHHVPYPLRTARLLHCEQSLIEALDIPPPQGPCHVLFSDGVDVEVFPLTGVTGLPRDCPPQ